MATRTLSNEETRWRDGAALAMSTSRHVTRGPSNRRSGPDDRHPDRAEPTRVETEETSRLENVASSRPVSSRESQRQSGGRASPARVETTFQRGDDEGRAGTRGRSRGSSSARLAGVRAGVREFVREFVRSSADGEHGDDDQAEARVDVDWWC